jgi:hypothetical protein
MSTRESCIRSAHLHRPVSSGRGRRTKAQTLVLALTIPLLLAMSPSPGLTTTPSSRAPVATDAFAKEATGQSLAALKADAASIWSGEMVKDHGPFTTDDRKKYGRTDYVVPADVDAFVLDDGSLLLTLANSTVDRDGSVTPPPEIAENGSFSGSWGSEYSHFTTIYNSNALFTKTYCPAGGGGCYTITCPAGYLQGKNTTKFLYHKLSEQNTTYDYWGVQATGVAELNKPGDALCRAWVDGFGVGIRSTASNAVYMENDPLVDYSGTSCTTKSYSVSGTLTWGGGSATGGVSTSNTSCDLIDIINGGAISASNWYKAVYDDKGRKPKNERSVALVSVIRTPNGSSSGLVFWNMMRIGSEI